MNLLIQQCFCDTMETTPQATTEVSPFCSSSGLGRIYFTLGSGLRSRLSLVQVKPGDPTHLTTDVSSGMGNALAQA